MILKVVIAQDDGLRAMDQIAMEQAIETLKTKGYSIPEVRRYKVGGRDITDEFKKKNDIHENNNGCSGAP